MTNEEYSVSKKHASAKQTKEFDYPEFDEPKARTKFGKED